VLAILFNCSEPEAISKALEGVHSDSELRKILNDRSILLGAYANRLTQVDPNWILADSEAPQPLRNDLDEKRYWEDFVKVWIDRLGVQIIGGCCGITPEHIRYIRAELDKR
jgi:S-methylmethionine-dependent homocysteine/selenocysteine methylase